jgi:fructoselysine and glucoselysine-specific PTS system IID component
MNIPVFFSIFLRSLFLQSVWNYERMQNVGFVFTIIPWLKKIYGSTQKFYERIKAHYGFFNTHPYLANILIGITMRLEEQYAKNEIGNEEVLKTKTILAGPIAAIGDRLIWSTWRVFCGILVIGYFLVNGRNFYFITNALIGIIGYLLIYNFIGHLPIRFFGIHLGYKYSKEIVEKMAKFGLQKIVEVVRMIGIVVLLIVSIIYSVSLLDNIFLVFLFWLNVFTALLLHKKIAEIFIFLILLCFNTLLFIVFKK